MPAYSLIKNVLTYFDDDAEKCYFKFYGFTDSRSILDVWQSSECGCK